MEFRKLSENDYHLGYLELLSQLTTVGEISFEEFKNQFNLIQQNPNHLIYVIEHNQRIIATGTLLIEPKFIHQLGRVGHIEDIVIDHYHRNQGLGQKLIQHLINIGQKLDCYKIILDCQDKLVPFYQSCGFNQKQLQMSVYI